MLTLKKIAIYRRYDGDNDSWARSGSKQDKSSMDDADWYLIFRFIGDLTLVKNGLAAENYVKDLNQRLLDNCDSQDTINEVKNLADQSTKADNKNETDRKSMFRKLLDVFKKTK